MALVGGNLKTIQFQPLCHGLAVPQFRLPRTHPWPWAPPGMGHPQLSGQCQGFTSLKHRGQPEPWHSPAGSSGMCLVTMGLSWVHDLYFSLSYNDFHFCTSETYQCLCKMRFWYPSPPVFMGQFPKTEYLELALSSVDASLPLGFGRNKSAALHTTPPSTSAPTERFVLLHAGLQWCPPPFQQPHPRDALLLLGSD